MSNQMIALQAKGPQLADPAAQTAKFVNMMNMTKQQEAAERQAAQAQQAMTLAQRKDAREEALQGPALTKAEIDNVRAQIDDLEEQYKMVSTDEGHQFWLGRVRKVDGAIADQIGMYVPNFDPEKVNNIMLTAKQAVDKIDPDAKATIEYAGKGGVDEQGNPIPEGTAIQVITGKKPSTQVIRNAPNAQSPAPAAAPQAAAPAGPIPTGKFGETRVVPDSARPLTADQQDHIRRMQEELGMANTPASFSPGASAGQMTPQRAQQIVDAAVTTRVMSQEDFDQMLVMTPEQNKQPFMDMIRSSNIKLQPGGMGQQPQFADLRGQRGQSQTAGLGGDMSMMRNTEVQYQPLQRRDPNVSPLPGVYNVPTSQVAEKARAERETPGEVYAKEKARAKAQREAALEAGPKPLTVPQEAKLRENITKDYKSARSTIDMMLNPVAGVVAAVNNVRKLSPTQKEAITGYSGYLPTIYAGTKSADTAVKNLKGKVTEMGKSVAALTGAIGQMAVQEWRIVSDMIASLDLEGMGAADLDTQLDIIEAQARRAAAVTRDAYENQYVEEFDRYPGRFRLPDASAVAAPAAKRKTLTKGAVDRNNPLLRK